MFVQLALYALIQPNVVGEEEEACSFHCKAAGQAAPALSSVALLRAARRSAIGRASRHAQAEYIVTFDVGRRAFAEGNRER